MNKIYLDANIFHNLWKDEFIGNIPAGYFAERLREEILECRFFLVTSNLLVLELIEKHAWMESLIDRDFSVYKSAGKLHIYEMDELLVKEAKALAKKHKTNFSGAHWKDMVHLLIAKSQNSILVTRDKTLLEIATLENVSALHPEELLS